MYEYFYAVSNYEGRYMYMYFGYSEAKSTNRRMRGLVKVAFESLNIMKSINVVVHRDTCTCTCKSVFDLKPL